MSDFINEKIVIGVVGKTGDGKSALCRKMAQYLGMKGYEKKFIEDPSA